MALAKARARAGFTRTCAAPAASSAARSAASYPPQARRPPAPRPWRRPWRKPGAPSARRRSCGTGHPARPRRSSPWPHRRRPRERVMMISSSCPCGVCWRSPDQLFRLDADKRAAPRPLDGVKASGRASGCRPPRHLITPQLDRRAARSGRPERKRRPRGTGHHRRLVIGARLPGRVRRRRACRGQAGPHRFDSAKSVKGMRKPPARNDHPEIRTPAAPPASVRESAAAAICNASLGCVPSLLPPAGHLPSTVPPRPAYRSYPASHSAAPP